MLPYIIYGCCIFLLLWGGKFAGFSGKKFHENSSSIDVSKSIRGLAALGIILHHISQESTFQHAQGFGRYGVLDFFVNRGFFFVAVFFFFSGFGLIKNLNTKENYLDGFLKKRVVKTMLVPFYVNVLLYAVYLAVCRVKMPLIQWVTNFLGITMMNFYAWYPIVAIILYLAFYFIFKNVKNRKLAYFLIFLIIFLQGVFFCFNGHFAWWAGEANWWLKPGAMANAPWWKQSYVIYFYGEWWVNSSMTFLVGMLFAQYEEKIRAWFKKGYWIKLIAVVALFLLCNYWSNKIQGKFGYWTEYSGRGPGILDKFVSYCSQIPQICLFSVSLYVLMMKYYVVNPVSRFFGSISYETYMMNLIGIETFRFLILKNTSSGTEPIYKDGLWNLGLYAVCVIASTVLLALFFKWCSKKANKLIK